MKCKLLFYLASWSEMKEAKAKGLDVSSFFCHHMQLVWFFAQSCYIYIIQCIMFIAYF